MSRATAPLHPLRGVQKRTFRIGEEFVGWKPPAGGDRALGVVDFSIFPHLDPDCPDNTMAAAERWAAQIAGPAFRAGFRTTGLGAGDRTSAADPS
ncbi:hypothetical protein AB0P05_27335 [Streptomyces flaveolus]|uniref:hypothetical protein n=1 Tax=Streptomyces flaveolus TaxID=67297 RepID=UPI00342A98FA